MSKIDENTVKSILVTALEGAKGAAGAKWGTIASFASNEISKLIQDAAMLSSLISQGKLSPEQAALHMDLQKQAARAVLLAVEGIGLIVAEQIINAAIDAIRAPLNKLIGVSLL